MYASAHTHKFSDLKTKMKIKQQGLMFYHHNTHVGIVIW